MKIRADFVTNSSSSCYVTIVIDTKDGQHFAGAFVGDEVGHFEGGVSQNPEFTLKESLQATNGKDLLKVIDDAYSGLFSSHEELDKLFQDDEPYHLITSQLKENNIEWPVGGQKELEGIPMSQIKNIRIIESRSGDEFGSSGELTVDYEKQEEHISRSHSFASMDFEAMEDEDFDGEPPEITVEQEHEEIRNWKTGEVNVLKDEENVVRDEDEDEDEDDYE